jgi:hypothetical protein
VQSVVVDALVDEVDDASWVLAVDLYPKTEAMVGTGEQMADVESHVENLAYAIVPVERLDTRRFVPKVDEVAFVAHHGPSEGTSASVVVSIVDRPDAGFAAEAGLAVGMPRLCASGENLPYHPLACPRNFRCSEWLDAYGQRPL